MTEIDDHVHECEISFTRSQVYGLLARIFSSSDQVLDNTLLRDLGRVTSETSDYVELDDDLACIKEAIRAIAPTVREMNQEYTRLFSKGEAPPYECSYVPSSRVTHELADISGFFLAFGVQPKGERQDNLSSELEFMSFLCLKESIAQSNQMLEEAKICRDAQTKFLTDHLGRWIGVHHRLVTDKTNFPIYPLLVGLVHKIVTRDASYLGARIDEIIEVPIDEAQDLPGCGIGSNSIC